MQTHAHLPTHRRGFTLVEVLVALALMAVLAVMSWRGLEAMLRAQATHTRVTNDLAGLQAGVAQWTQDLDMLVQTPELSAIDWNTQVLRLTRRAPAGGAEGLVVVAWTRRLVRLADNDATAASTVPAAQWLRWQSGVLRTRGELRSAWQEAATGPGAEGAALLPGQVAIVPLTSMQVQFFHNGSWVDGADPAVRPAADAPADLPGGVRLLLALAFGATRAGVLQSDWANPSTPLPLLPSAPPPGGS